MGFQHRNDAGVDGPGAAEQYSQEIRPHLLSDIDRLNQARAKLDRLTDQLEVIADWQDDFRKRRARAELKFALIGLDIAEHEALASEAEDFKRVCKALSWLRRAAA
jgi:hypothetical protein